MVSCEKSVNKVATNKDIITTDYFSTATNLNTLKNVNRIKINDSLTKVSGVFNQYRVDGYINNTGQKINWWKIINTRDNNEYNAKVEYRIIDNKEKVNQFILFNNQGNYNKNSKFFSKEKLSKGENTFKYSFYTPSEYPKKNLLKKFEYFLYIDNKEVKHSDLDCIQEDSHFFVNVEAPKSNQKIIIKGLFTELFEDNNKNPGQNEIYVLDTLK